LAEAGVEVEAVAVLEQGGAGGGSLIAVFGLKFGEVEQGGVGSVAGRSVCGPEPEERADGVHGRVPNGRWG
jgi:hypothetical protein